MPNLAIHGGHQVFPGGVPQYFRWPIYDDAEKRSLIEVLESGRWCSREHPEGKVAQAEASVARIVGTRHAQCMSSGSMAIEMALRACQIHAGDEVIVPASTFIATASCVAAMGGVPVYVDIEPDTYQMSPDAVEAAITDRTRAILPVHYGGYPADMDRLPAIAEKHGLAMIEDCAEAFGTEWRGKMVGSFGDVGCFSFQMGKPLTCGEGGAITYDRDELAVRCYSFPRTASGGDGASTYYLPAPNWRLSEFCGAVLLPQLGRIEQQTEEWHRNAEHLARGIRAIEGLDTLKEDERITKMGYFFYFVRYDAARWNGIPRDRFMDALRAEGLFCSTAHNEPLYRVPAYRWCSPRMDFHCPEAERIFSSEVVSFGKGILQSRELVDRVLETLHKMRDNLDELARDPVPGTRPAPGPPAAAAGRRSGLKSFLKRVIG